MEADFSGYATKNGLKCSDGRTIIAGAFKHNDKQKVPLVWQHQHNESFNILGHALLENREDGVYAHGFFNDTEGGQNAKALVKHGDITALSIRANNLSQKGANVIHGDIQEVSLVLAGANPGAYIDNVNLKHGDSYETIEDEAVIYTGLTLEHGLQGDNVTDTTTNADSSTTADTNTNAGKTVQEVFDTMTDEQKQVVYAMLNDVIEDAQDGGADENSEDGDTPPSSDTTQHSNENGSENLQHNQDQEGTNMTRNVFEQNAETIAPKSTLTHAQLQTIFTDAEKMGSLKEAFLAHVDSYGIENIDYLFPPEQLVTSSPEFISRRMEWVAGVINGVKKSPFSRIKSVAADITADEARAKGYVKGNLKKEEVVALLKRVTTPTTIYKKQKLDRDDIVDITDLDVVAWIKAEMRIMLDEEIARAVLLGDSRDAEDIDKVSETNIRPIISDDAMYAVPVGIAPNTAANDLVEAILRARPKYKGTGTPDLYTTLPVMTDMLLAKDKMGRRLYMNKGELVSALGVGDVIPCEAMELHVGTIGILVNLTDYTVGADKGGALSMFDFFDIDYNQYKYLMETRISGALTKPLSALVFSRASGTEAVPTTPSFNQSTNTITFPSITGVSYEVGGVAKTGTLVIAEDSVVNAVATTGYYFPANITTEWTYTFVA